MEMPQAGVVGTAKPLPDNQSPFTNRVHNDSVGKHHLLPGPLRLCAFARGPARTLPTESNKGGRGASEAPRPGWERGLGRG
jgi:hypothetical protein